MEPLYRTIEEIVRPVLWTWFRWDFDGLEVLGSGPRIVVANHPSYIDPFAIAYFHKVAGRRARFLAKSELFKNPALKAILNGMKQIPVYRGTTEAGSSLRAAEDAIHRGESVVVFLESTIGPGLPLLPAKTGAARLALATGAPVATLATWGGQKFMTKRQPRHLGPRKPISVVGGDIQTYEGDVEDREMVNTVTKQLHERLTTLVTETAARGIHAT